MALPVYSQSPTYLSTSLQVIGMNYVVGNFKREIAENEDPLKVQRNGKLLEYFRYEYIPKK
jgi:hypothetical protein